jgi:hypothetical protein
MKIRMTRSYHVWESYEAIEINPEDYPELEGMTEEEVVSYLNDNIYDFELKDSSETTLIDEFMFNGNIIKDNEVDEEYEIFLD